MVVLRVLGTIGALAMLLATGVYAWSEARMTASWDVEPAPLEVPPTADLAARGQAIATFRGCRDCHGEDLAGRVVIDDLPVMRLVSANLTPAGVGGEYSDEDWARAIRHGVRPDGSAILFMPSQEYTALSHEDLAALIAYLRSVPPAAPSLPSTTIGAVGRGLFLAGKLPLVPAELIDHATRPASPAPGPTAEYGRYLGSACTGCHGEHLSGGSIPGVPASWPMAANLTSHESGLAAWTEEDFVRAMRTGARPDGSELAAEYMPWPMIAQSSDDDLRALWAYTRSVAPRPMGNR